MKMPRTALLFLASALTLSMTSGGLIAGAWAAPLPESLSEVIEYSLLKTRAGSEFMGRVTGVVAKEVSTPTYRSFLQRMSWAQSETLNQEVRSTFSRIETEFEAYRVTQAREAKLAQGEHLTADEKAFLDRAAEHYGSNRLDDLMKQNIEFIDALIGPHARIEDRIGAADAFLAVPTSGGEVPPLPGVAAAGPSFTGDIRDLKLEFWRKMFMRFKAYRDTFKAFALSEGQWKSLFLESGRRFSPSDLVLIRKNYRLLDVLNDYARMRLVVRAFAAERSALYTRLNELTIKETREFMDGYKGVDAYVNARKAAATSLELNDIVWEAEKRMLKVIKRCHELGGKMQGAELGSGEIAIAEQNLKEMQDRLLEIQNRVLKQKVRLKSLTGEEAAQLKRSILRAESEVSLWRSRLDTSAKDLEIKYLEFVENRGQIEIFANLRMGRVNSEVVTPFDMADPFVVSQKQLDLWDSLYDRSLADSTSAIVTKEGVAFIKSQAGSTRKFVRDLNDLTGKFFGKRFTDTEFGAQFQEYEKHIAIVVLKRALLVAGVTLPSGAVLDKYGALIASKIHDAVFGLVSTVKSAGGPSSGDRSRESDELNSDGSARPSSFRPSARSGSSNSASAGDSGVDSGADSGAASSKPAASGFLPGIRVPDSDSDSVPRGGRIIPGTGIRP